MDLPGLLWQQRLQLVNMPLGSTAITLTARDLGNFMAHPIMMEAGAQAVQVGRHTKREPPAVCLQQKAQAYYATNFFCFTLNGAPLQ